MQRFFGLRCKERTGLKGWLALAGLIHTGPKLDLLRVVYAELVAPSIIAFTNYILVEIKIHIP